MTETLYYSNFGLRNTSITFTITQELVRTAEPTGPVQT